ncbi:uncharacterized protein GGS22DRAFT_172474 [Annulohypoxylon maeteangense]|uniref:uncharacterized protein n=1 Tax=Annulohypoxylon maeteangense TaxID=1927788 RepID=UPI002007445B|nr:uncharacterized protein GGS22DRAFT_172474 [Annulohypoxylon maeteangense]KAI0881567.1 hypothetical protein GGS22DRAFT_172474 [Annulohypoxylon maeteangense]
MAEFDDIEYKGVGEGKHIDVGSDRCFRDYSPGDTVISLSDDGQALYSRAIPNFSEPPQDFPRLSLSSQQPQPERHYGISPPLSHDSLVAIQGHNPPRLENGLSPLARYRRDPQAHEQIALGIKINDSPLHLDLESTPPVPAEANGKLQSGEISSLHLSSSPNPTPSTGRGSSSAAAQLQELLGMIQSPEWEDNLSPEEQAEHLRRATILKRRVRSETNPRESRPPKVRKRSRASPHDEKDHR